MTGRRTFTMIKVSSVQMKEGGCVTTYVCRPCIQSKPESVSSFRFPVSAAASGINLGHWRHGVLLLSRVIRFHRGGRGGGVMCQTSDPATGSQSGQKTPHWSRVADPDYHTQPVLGNWEGRHRVALKSCQRWKSIEFSLRWNERNFTATNVGFCLWEFLNRHLLHLLAEGCKQQAKYHIVLNCCWDLHSLDFFFKCINTFVGQIEVSKVGCLTLYPLLTLG